MEYSNIRQIIFEYSSQKYSNIRIWSTWCLRIYSYSYLVQKLFPNIFVFVKKNILNIFVFVFGPQKNIRYALHSLSLSIVFSTISLSFFNSKLEVSLVSFCFQVSVIHNLNSLYSILYYFLLSLQCLLSTHSISSISLFSALLTLCYSQYQILLLGYFSGSQFQNSLGLRFSRFLSTTPVVIMSSCLFHSVVLGNVFPLWRYKRLKWICFDFFSRVYFSVIPSMIILVFSNPGLSRIFSISVMATYEQLGGSTFDLRQPMHALHLSRVTGIVFCSTYCGMPRVARRKRQRGE